MTNREAIERLEYDMAMILFNPDTGEELTLEQVKNKNEDNYTMYLANELAISALEKQEPMKPDKHVTDEKTWFCPRCHVAYKDVQPDYCFRCGQKLKWETWQYQIEF